MVQTKNEIPSKSIIIFLISLIWTFIMLFYNVDTGEFTITTTKVFIMAIYVVISFLTIFLGGNSNMLLEIWKVLKDTTMTPEEKMRRIEVIIIEAVSIWNAINQANPPTQQPTAKVAAKAPPLPPPQKQPPLPQKQPQIPPK